MIRIYFGKSGAGKDYCLKQDVATGYWTPIVCYTNREMRENEVPGVDYHFVTDNEFASLILEDSLAEYCSFNFIHNGVKGIRYYGSPIVNPNEKNYVCVLNAAGVKSYIDRYGSDNLEIIYVHASDEVRERRARARGSFNQAEWERRYTQDECDLSEEVIDDIIRRYGKSICMYKNE